MKVVQADTPYFNIISPTDIGHKTAPGMDIVFIIEFLPDEKKVFTLYYICIFLQIKGD